MDTIAAPKKLKSGNYNCQLDHLTASVRAGLAVEHAAGLAEENQKGTLRDMAKQFSVSYESVRDANRIKREHPSRFPEILTGKASVLSLMKELVW